MPSSFTRSELGIYSTVSEQLRKAREERGMSIPACAQSIAIQEKYLRAIEDSRYEELPGELYARSWIKKYARFLGLSEQECMISYEKELQVRSKLFSEAKRTKPTNRPKLWEILTLRRLAIAAVVLILLGYSGYLSYRTIRPPQVAINLPTAGFRTHESTILLAGRTEQGAEVRINQQQITLDADHRFSQEIALTNGLNTITLEAHKKHSLPFTTSVVIVKTPPPTILTASTTGPLITNE